MSEGSNDLRRSMPDLVQDIVRSVHRSSSGRINQSVCLHQRVEDVVVNDGNNTNDDLEHNAIPEDYIQDASTADFADDDNGIPVLDDDLGNPGVDDGDDLVSPYLFIYYKLI